MQTIRIENRNYISARKELKSFDYSLKANNSLNYYYCSFVKNSYSIEEIADNLATEQTIVIFYVQKTQNLAVVFAHSKKQTKFVDLKVLNSDEVKAILSWFALNGSANNEIIATDDVSSDLYSGLKCKVISKKTLITISKKNRNLISSFKRSVIRSSALIFIGMGVLTNSLFDKLQQEVKDMEIEKGRVVLLLSKKSLDIGKERDMINSIIESGVTCKLANITTIYVELNFKKPFQTL